MFSLMLHFLSLIQHTTGLKSQQKSIKLTFVLIKIEKIYFLVVKKTHITI